MKNVFLMIRTPSIKLVTLVIVIATVMGLVSCKSTPKTVEPVAVKFDESATEETDAPPPPPTPSKVEVVEQKDREIEVVEQKDREYVVRLIPERRDSLWRIAEYEHIYDNPWEWERIYNANRNIIDDPDLIHPGQRLIIPPITEELE